MRYEAIVRAYDMLDQVVITAVVVDTTLPVGTRYQTAAKATTTIAGEGTDTPRDWLREALIGLLEAL